MTSFAIALHAGAGRIDRRRATAARETERRQALADALLAGFSALSAGAPALDAVEQAVRGLEDCAHFNAGRGSALSADGAVETDAAVMDGRAREAGAVAAVRGVRNPVSAARAVLERSGHVLLVGAGAETFCREQGLAFAPMDFFVTEERREQLARAREAGGARPPRGAGAGDTVGAVARDGAGRLAAAASTGGTVQKRPGRAGDSPIPGAGLWADDATCAVSATGDGEVFVRCAFAHEIDSLLRHTARDLHGAAASALERVRALGGAGGCVAIDRAGRIAMPFNAEVMYRGWIGPDGRPEVAVFRDEDLGL